MKLRTRTLLAIGGALVALVATLALVSSTLLVSNFNALDQSRTRMDVARVEQALSSDLDRLSRTAADWANWDEAYSFVQGTDSAFAGLYINDASLDRLRINLMAWVNADGRLVHVKLFDLSVQADREPPAPLLALISSPESRFRHLEPTSSVTGLCVLSGTPLLLSSVPVLHSDASGPPAGRLFLGRWLDATLVAEIASKTQTTFRVEPETEGALAEDTDAPVRMHPSNGDSLVAEASLKNIWGEPGVVLTIGAERSTYLEGRKAVRFLVGSLAGVGLLFALIVLLPLERNVLRRMTLLSREVRGIAEARKFEAEVKGVGNDELGQLAGSVNQLLASLRQLLQEKETIMADLVQARDMAEAGTKSKSVFLANMSHEIRTPMHGIIGLTDLLNETKLSVEQREHVEGVAYSAKSLLRIINDILDFSKIEARKMRLEEVAFELRETIEAATHCLDPLVNEKRLTLEVEIDAAVPRVLIGDANRVRQVISNLVSNAVKFTEHGSVRAFVSLDHASESSATLRFAIRDTGQGIPPEGMSRLFQSFVQLDSSAARKHGGTGLGLAISKELVELMGGEIGAESTPGVGSVFWFTVPFALPMEQTLPREETATEPLALSAQRMGAMASPQRTDAAGMPRASTSSRRLRVLLAEDNLLNQRLAARVLERLGHHVDVVPNGLEAVLAVERNAYDLILMDCQMPEMDGIEATREIRQKELRRAGGRGPVRIVALTASAMPGDERRCFEAGMDGYLTKPISPADLAAAIAREQVAIELSALIEAEAHDVGESRSAA